MLISSQASSRVTNVLLTLFNLKFGTSIDLQTTRVYVNCHPVPSRLDFSVTLSCELPAQRLLSRLLVAVSQVSGGGFVESEASVLLMIVFVERMCAQLSNVES